MQLVVSGQPRFARGAPSQFPRRIYCTILLGILMKAVSVRSRPGKILYFPVNLVWDDKQYHSSCYKKKQVEYYAEWEMEEYMNKVVQKRQAQNSIMKTICSLICESAPVVRTASFMLLTNLMHLDA